MKSITLLNYTCYNLGDLLVNLNRLNNKYNFNIIMEDRSSLPSNNFYEDVNSEQLLNNIKKSYSKNEYVIILVDIQISHPLLVISNFSIISAFSPVENIIESNDILKMFNFSCALFRNDEDYSLSDLSILKNSEEFSKHFNGLISGNAIKKYILDNANIDSGNMLIEKRVALITHGFNTHAHWSEDAKKQLQDEFNVNSVIKRYSFVTLMLFLIPTFRKRFANKILDAINSMIADYPNYKYSIIAHSFGTLIVTKALENADELNIELHIDSLIMNGAIVDRDYNWKKYLNKGKSNVNINKILNVCGDGDFLPILSKVFVLGTGNSGSYFFSDESKNFVNIRLKNSGHSDMINKNKNRTVWGKFICNNSFEFNDNYYPKRHLGYLHFITRYIHPYVTYIMIIFLIVIISISTSNF